MKLGSLLAIFWWQPFFRETAVCQMSHPNSEHLSITMTTVLCNSRDHTQAVVIMTSHFTSVTGFTHGILSMTRVPTFVNVGSWVQFPCHIHHPRLPVWLPVLTFLPFFICAVGGRTNGGTGLGVDRVRATIRWASGPITWMLWPFVWSAIAFAIVFSIQIGWLLCILVDCTNASEFCGTLSYMRVFETTTTTTTGITTFLMKTKLVVILLLVL